MLINDILDLTPEFNIHTTILELYTNFIYTNLQCSRPSNQQLSKILWNASVSLASVWRLILSNAVGTSSTSLTSQKSHHNRDGGSAIHVVSDKSLLSNFDPDAKCISEPAFLGDVYLQGAGEMKIRLKDGTVVLLKEVFYSDQLRENILSSVAYNSFFTGVVGNKLIRLDTGAEIGYLHNGTPQVDVEVLDFDYPIDETSLTKQPKLPAMMLGRLNEPTQSLSAEEVNDEDEESEDDREFLE
ncbi:hypothetical protein OXX79_001633, partial [Metschnikowia pulcherrima]